MLSGYICIHPFKIPRDDSRWLFFCTGLGCGIEKGTGGEGGIMLDRAWA